MDAVARVVQSQRLAVLKSTAKIDCPARDRKMSVLTRWLAAGVEVPYQAVSLEQLR